MAGQTAKMVPVLRGEISNTQSRPLNEHPPGILLLCLEFTSRRQSMKPFISAYGLGLSPMRMHYCSVFECRHVCIEGIDENQS